MSSQGDHNPELSRHILPTAATLLGICTTLIGLVKILEERIGPSRVDEHGAVIAVLFLGSALSSYGAIRSLRQPGLSRRLEQIADILFLCGLLGLTVLSLLFAYELV